MLEYVFQKACGKLLALFPYSILLLKTKLIGYSQINIVRCDISLFRTYSGPENGPLYLWVPCHCFHFVCLLSHSPAACYFAIWLISFNLTGMHKQELADQVNLGTSPRKLLISLSPNVRKCKGTPFTKHCVPSYDADGFNSVYSLLTS